MDETKEDLIIIPHLGLGDQIVINGLVRILHNSGKYKKIRLVTQQKFLSNVEFMYRDLSNIDYISSENNLNVDSVSNIVKSKYVGKFLDRWWYNTKAVNVHEEEVYTSLGYKWTDRYEHFSVDRDFDKENKVFLKLITDSKPYIVVCDDPSRNYIIKPEKAIDVQNLNIIRTSDYLDYTLFDFLKVIENAESVHTMYSSFFLLIDCMSLNKIYLHNSYLHKVNPLESYGVPMMNLLKQRNITAL